MHLHEESSRLDQRAGSAPGARIRRQCRRVRPPPFPVSAKTLGPCSLARPAVRSTRLPRIVAPSVPYVRDGAGLPYGGKATPILRLRPYPPVLGFSPISSRKRGNCRSGAKRHLWRALCLCSKGWEFPLPLGEG